MSPRLFGALVGLAMTLVSSVAASHPVSAQGLPPGPGPAGGVGELLTNPGALATTMFNAALVNLGQNMTTDVVGFMDWLLGNGNVISQTPPGLSYASDVVQRFSGTLRAVANVGLAVVTVIGGINLIVHPHIRAPYHGALELVPRVLLSGIMINTSLGWGRFVIDLNNALCRAIGSTSMPGWGSVLQPPQAGSALLDLIAMAIYLINGLLLLGQMLMRLALLDLLLAIAPLALLCWVLPQTNSWARVWFATFFSTVFVQSVQVLVLQLGSDLMQRLPTMLPSLGSDPVGNGRVWLVTLFLGVAILQLTRTVPRLMPGAAGGSGSGSGSGPIRLITSLARRRLSESR